VSETPQQVPLSPGIHLVHKPVGPTSFSIVRAWSGRAAAAPERGRPLKICHGGTLDPFAGGLLLILVGQATKLFDHLHAIPKVYEATIRWGVETDNGDPLGRVVSTGDATRLSPPQLQDAVRPFVGWHEQTPPATSAKRIGGERAYEKALRGETVELPPSRVYLHEARWLSHDLSAAAPTSRVRVVVRGGYYVRALARDLGRTLGCGAHLAALHRAAIGPWTDPAAGESVAITGRALLPWLPSRELSDQEVGELRQRRPIKSADVTPPDWPLPPGFPCDAEDLVRGFHRQRLLFVLRREVDALAPVTELLGGL